MFSTSVFTSLGYSSGREALLTAWGCDGDVDGTLSSGICAVDCVWNCVVGDKKSEEKFIVHLNGVGHLLECFEVGPNVLKRQL
ncbi:hypothetical protein Pmar_PMAR022636 [Perkinsus marinus ATCC 50983]|uniref:Uncharacterized protein n=1 Tax=Perkinsus marinus (strain ATCC 50983 / TXsc) TaxID=423536 RepID=C5L9J0_PERM5|nr:hypothetical protein Pmar_PMAR022636 [Perkinsus marinus ATCC 50983]EER06583.1 hypothetical protein Pmar_PMAR022636 [Perkinsus marinus ATCC 50983]|eukprot:XP_002774767.1 hypothetical protein Pmar_PMAR022636 [Perkinsus marinus ATCC 50983]